MSQKQKEKVNFSTNSCMNCKKVDTEEMVACDKCSAWFHFSCVGVDNTVGNPDVIWNCFKCEDEFRSAFGKAGMQHSPKKPNSSDMLEVTELRKLLDEQRAQFAEMQISLNSSINRQSEQIAEMKKAHESDIKRLQDAALEAFEKAQSGAKRTLQEVNAKALDFEEKLKKSNEREITSANEIQRFKRLYEESSRQSDTGPSQTGAMKKNWRDDISKETLADRYKEIKEKQLNDHEARINSVEAAIALFNEKSLSFMDNPQETKGSQLLDLNDANEIEDDIFSFPQINNLNDKSPENAVDQENQRSLSYGFDRLATTMNRQFLQKLPKYDGDEKEWAVFEAVYNSTSQAGKFTEAENVTRLRESLKPPALDLVQDLVLYTTDAKRIMEELKEAFGRPQRLVLRLTSEVLSLQSLRNQPEEKLREFATKVKSFVATIKSLKRGQDLNNVYALECLSLKLRSNNYKDWVKIMNKNPNANLETFADFLREKVKEIPPAAINWRFESAQETHKNSSTAQGQRILSHVQNGSARNTRTRSCLFCKDNHAIWDCREFKEMPQRARTKFVYDEHICSSCLKTKNHQWRECFSKRQCSFKDCTRFHHELLHNDQSLSQNNDVQQDESRTKNSEVVSHIPPNSHFTHQGVGSILFKIVAVRLRTKSGDWINSFAYLDDGSAMTLIDFDLFQQLKIDGKPEQIHLQWTKGIKRSEDSFCTNIEIRSMKHRHGFTLNNVYTVRNLGLPKQTVKSDYLRNRYRHLKSLPIPEMNNAQPKILIGLQHATFLSNEKCHQQGDDDPIACKTKLGWVVFGRSAPTMNIKPVSAVKKPFVQMLMHEATKNDEELHEMVKFNFTTENFGTMPPKQDLMNEETKRALEILQRTVKIKDGRYEVGLLWKRDDIKLPESLPMAMKRLQCLEKSLKNNPELLIWKNNHMKDSISKKYCRIATAEELRKPWPRVWYTPTFIVQNPNKLPPKPRDVADVAAVVDGQSLNSNLLKGPDNLAPLLGGLFKFREHAIAVNADVKEMFHQIRIIESDQHCQRILWRDGDSSRSPTVYIMQSMMFGPTCSPSCAQYIKNQHAQKYAKIYPAAVSALINNTYVDDYFNSHNTVEEAYEVTSNAIEICSTMGMDLISAQSNSVELLNMFPQDHVKPSLVNIDPNASDSFMTKVLGMFWQTFPDNFTYQLCESDLVEKMRDSSYQPTKREVLKVIMKIFDPLGLIAHYIIRGKIILQEIWREGTNWDEPIPITLRDTWHKFIIELKNIEKMKIPRQYAPVNPKECNVQLIVFVDASEKAFAATAYFRFEKENDTHVAHVMGKAKVAPIKKLTVPQLELQAAVLGVRLAETIKKLTTFPIHDVAFLSDSKVVLSWINSRKCDYKTFVAVRIGEILESSTRRQWYKIGTNANVADDATKWTDPSMGDNSSRWTKGPEFLYQQKSEWPLTAIEKCDADEENFMQMMLVLPISQDKLPSYDKIDSIAPRFHERWTSLVNVIAYILRCKKKYRSGEKFLTPNELERAERVIFRKIQTEAFPNEVAALKSYGPKPLSEKTILTQIKPTSSIFKLTPFMCENKVIRMGTRSQLLKASYAARNPAILPNKHPLVDLLIQNIHEKNMHMSEDTTIADLREKAWIISTRVAVRRVKSRCQLCKNKSAKPQMPLMGQLPLSRLEFGVKPFTHVGIDCFGPYDVIYNRGTAKRYGIIFTCLTYRAVHLELIDSMSTDECMSAIRELLTRRGPSKHFYSDNGKNFIGANNQLLRDLNEMSTILGKEVAEKYRIHWHFIPAYSPWMGGAWERLIHSIKRCIEYLMNGEKPKERILQRALREAEYHLNRRPLTHIAVDPDDKKPLTPNIVMFGDEDEERAMAPMMYSESDAFSAKSYRRVQHLAQKFAHRWIREYIPELTKRSKWHNTTKPIEVGNVVIVVDPSEPRNMWQKGRVSKIYEGTDGVIRAADVKLADGNIKFRRAVGRLAVLDV